MRIRGDAVAAASPVARETARFDARVWRDPRLLLGVLLMLGATVTGGFAVAAADHTVSYWATAGPVRTGEPVRRADLVAVRAKVPQRTARGLLLTEEALPNRLDELSWAAGTRAGTLVTRDLLTTRQRTVELPIAVPAGGAPANLRAGDRVDVWASVAQRPEATTTASTSATSPAQRILEGVRVLSRSAATSVGGSGQTVVVDVAGQSVSGRIIGAASSGHITIVRVS